MLDVCARNDKLQSEVARDTISVLPRFFENISDRGEKNTEHFAEQ